MPASTTITECQNDGSDMRLYYDISGTCETPVLVEHVGIIGDMNIGDVDDENQVNRRGSAAGIKTYNPGDSEVSVTGQQIVDGNYEGFLAITKAKKGGSAGAFLALTGPISEVNAVGYFGKWFNFDRSISGPAEDEMEASFNLKPAACSDCLVRSVKVAVAGTAADWDQTTLPA
jgi:hypothetical protein